MPGEPIRMGTALVAPEGFESLQKGSVYFFLVNSAADNCVRLVEFIRGKLRRVGKKRVKRERLPPTTNLFTLKSTTFEDALQKGLIKVADTRYPLPPWRESNHEKGANVKDAQERDKRSEARIDSKLLHLGPLITDLRAVLLERNPIAKINAAARSARPAQNEARFRAHFFLYAVFGRAGIAYQSQDLGRWSRVDHPGAKSGPKSREDGQHFGRPANDQQSRQSVEDGWDVFGQPGRSIREVHRLTCVHILHCTVVRKKNGTKRFILPDGEPAYTYDQFYHRLTTKFGADEIRRAIHGRARQREDFDPSEGQVSESVNSAGEIVEEDARWVKELAIGPDGKTVMPPLIVVRIVCVATAICLGLGFALGAETGAAYRMARFCMEVGKDFFCWLFGLTVGKEDWPCEGAVDDVVNDRGPGQAQTADPNDGQVGPVLREMAPTGFGQGKPNVEGTHPRHIKIADRPTHVVTQIPLVHLVRREIRNEIRRIHSASAERRLGPTLIMAVDNLTIAVNARPSAFFPAADLP